MPTPLPTAYSQVTWPGVGDVDDCQVIASFWALVASGSSTKAGLPTVTTFRAKAGNPDNPSASDGLTNAESFKAISALYPKARAYRYNGYALNFLNKIKRGEIATLSVRSSKLPPEMQFGFTGLHQIAIGYAGGRFMMMNPLQKQGAKLLVVTASQIAAAARAYLNDNQFHGIMLPGPLDTSAATITALKTEVAAAKAEATAAKAEVGNLTARIGQIKNKTAAFAADIADD